VAGEDSINEASIQGRHAQYACSKSEISSKLRKSTDVLGLELVNWRGGERRLCDRASRDKIISWSLGLRPRTALDRHGAFVRIKDLLEGNSTAPTQRFRE